MAEIRVPIMALVDYRGFRLIAMSVLPVSGNSLIYGSKDAGCVCVFVCVCVCVCEPRVCKTALLFENLI